LGFISNPRDTTEAPKSRVNRGIPPRLDRSRRDLRRVCGSRVGVNTEIAGM